jgi:hypothetical protein
VGAFGLRVFELGLEPFMGPFPNVSQVTVRVLLVKLGTVAFVIHTDDVSKLSRFFVVVKCYKQEVRECPAKT